ncbi:hypothetical protein EKL30_10260 [Candidimonas sp. SYP-B2681]|uniref:hypothetical protein n=1 Tax=Candidimonas sp. SYP-B2681 TaxID=2497686 RepID=UPI000F86BC68|nr:hypothetical protein [Candidimonas sp. SYP-B2681]RTZ43253.1 hypothetical protein EKL30_10260 [Candidimonas sp. SYP-B2681]
MIFKTLASIPGLRKPRILLKKWAVNRERAARLQRAGQETNHNDHKLDGGMGAVFFGSKVRV